MKIVQILGGISTPITNEEREFLKKHSSRVKITSLDERDQWLAQNLVRKGIYSISTDNNTLTTSINETDS